jgi:hypothetical protein
MAMRIIGVDVYKRDKFYDAKMTVRNDDMDLEAVYRMTYRNGKEDLDARLKFIESGVKNIGVGEESEFMLDDFPAFDMLEWLLKTYNNFPDDDDRIQAITDSWIDMTLGDFTDGEYDLT